MLHAGSAAEFLPEPPESAQTVAAELPTFARVYEEHFDFVWRCVQRFGVRGDAVADAVQEVFLVVHRKLPEFEGRSKVRTWLYGIVRRTVHNRRRDLSPNLDGRRSEFETDELPSGENGPDRRTELKTVLGLLEELDEDKREVFFLAELEQMSVVEISEMLGQNVNTMHARLRAARFQFEKACTRLRAREARWTR